MNRTVKTLRVSWKILMDGLGLAPSPLCNNNSRKVYKPQTLIKYMTLGISTLETVIFDSVDMDASRPGDQIRIDWTVHEGADGDYNNDALWRLTFNNADLEARGMYNHTNSGITQWNYTAQDNGYFQTPGAGVIRPGVDKTFSGFFDRSDVIGYEQVSAYGTSNNGIRESPNMAFVPIPEPVTAGMLGAGMVTALLLNRIKRHYRQR